MNPNPPNFFKTICSRDSKSVVTGQLGTLMKFALHDAFPFHKIWAVVNATTVSAFVFRAIIRLSWDDQNILDLPFESASGTLAGEDSTQVYVSAFTAPTFNAGVDLRLVEFNDQGFAGYASPARIIHRANKAELIVLKNSFPSGTTRIFMEVESRNQE